jgi:riboflavin kinase/FMN adenylyltransferase
VQAGRPERAALVLGREVEVEGVAVRGAGRGNAIGIPTANLDCQADLRPAIGIYAAWGELIEPEPTGPLPGGHLQIRRVTERHPAAVSVGYNATFTGGGSELLPLHIEAHFIRPKGAAPLPALYGRTVRLHLKSRLRDEQRFSSVDALVAQIHRDIDETKALLGVTW